MTSSIGMSSDWYPRWSEFQYVKCYIACVIRNQSQFSVLLVEASRRRPRAAQAEVGAARTMIGRAEERFGPKPSWLAAATAMARHPTSK